jgi:hypothetical protein
MSSMSDLSQGRVPPARVVRAVSKERGRAPATPVSAAVQPSAPAAVQPSIEQLTVNDVHDLSIAAINALVPINPSLVAHLIVEAGRKARAEIPAAPLSSLRPTARAICLAGERARGRELNAEESEFLAAFVEQLESTRAS